MTGKQPPLDPACWLSTEEATDVLREFYLPNAELEQAAAVGGQDRVAPGRAVAAGGLHHHQSDAASRSGEEVLQRPRDGRAVDQKGQVHAVLDAVEVRLQLFTLTYNLSSFLRSLALPDRVAQWSRTTLCEKLVKIGARIARHGRYVVCQLAEVAVLLAEILCRIDRLRPRPPRPVCTSGATIDGNPTSEVRP
jgi:Transposase DDE domain group 1